MLVWLAAGRLGKASRTARALHIATFFAALAAGLAAISLVGNVRTVATTFAQEPSKRFITAPVEWYSHVAVIDLVRDGTKLDREAARDLPPAASNAKELADRAHAIGVEAEARIPNPTSQQLTLWSLQQIISPLLALVSLVLLVIVLEAARKGDPFGSRAVRALSIIGIWLFVMFPLNEALGVLLSDSVTSGALQWYGTPPKSSSTLLIAPWLPGILVLAVAAVFKRGQELQEADRLTV
jgi:hypothetical protein